MAFLLRLTEDGPLGKAGEEVWVDDPLAAHGKHEAPAKKSAPKKQSAK